MFQHIKRITCSIIFLFSLGEVQAEVFKKNLKIEDFEMVFESDQASGIKLFINSRDFNTNNIDVKKFTLGSPSRVVIDILGLKLTRSYAETLRSETLGFHFADQLRAGAHSDKVRFVVDLNEEFARKLTLEELGALTLLEVESQQIVLSLRANSNAKLVQQEDLIAPELVAANSRLAPEKLPEKLPQKIEVKGVGANETEKLNVGVPSLSKASILAPIAQNKNADQESISSTEIKQDLEQLVAIEHKIESGNKPSINSAAEAETTKAIEQLAKNELTLEEAPLVKTKEPIIPVQRALVAKESRNQVTSFDFVFLGANRQPFLSIGISDKNLLGERLSFIKKREDLYVVELLRFEPISNALLLPHFPPREFAGINYLKAESLPELTRIEIGIERGTKLKVLPKPGQILLTRVNR